jgi:hypothetical protein
MKYIVTTVVDFVVEVDDASECPTRDAEAIVECHLEDDELVYAFGALPRVEPYEQIIA